MLFVRALDMVSVALSVLLCCANMCAVLIVCCDVPPVHKSVEEFK